MRRALLTLILVTGLLMSFAPASAETLTLPGSTVVIDDEAFYGAAGLDRVVLPEGIEKIGVRAFAGTGLRYINLPASVEQIDDSAFEACPELKVTAPKGSYAEAWALRMGYALEEAPTPASDFDYEITDGECAITEYKGQDERIRIPDAIEGAPVTRIGNGAFSHMDFIKSITLNDGLKAINRTAFEYCSGLESIEIPQSVTEIGESAFCYNTSLKTVVLHEGLKTIGGSAFSGCTSLERMEIPGSVTSLGSSVLYGASSLKTVVLHEGLQSIGYYAFNGCTSLERLEIPDSVTFLGSGYINYDNAITYLSFGSGIKELTLYHMLFTGSDDSQLETVVIPEGVLSIGDDIFEGYPRLKTVSLPESLTAIGEEAFRDCPGLTEITIPAGVKTIGYHAFWNCTGLAEVTLNEGLESIGGSAFAGCTSLKRLVVPDSVTYIGNYFLNSCNSLEYLSFGAGVKDLTADHIPDGTLAELVLRDGVETIGDYFCDTGTTVGKVTLSRTLRSIGKSAFQGSEFTELDIPASVTAIGEYAFRNCAGLETVTLHEGLQTIGVGAFLNCASLKGLFLPDSVTQIGNGFISGAMAMEYLSFGGGFKALTTQHLPNSAVLKKVVFGQGIESIPGYMFEDNYPELSCVVLPDTLTQIGSSAFKNCVSLTDLYLPGSLKTIGYRAFSGCDQLTEITIPGSVETIDDYAFYQCEGLRTVTLNEGLVSIGSQAFRECTALEALELPDSVTALGSIYGDSFVYGDTALSYIAFGGGVKVVKGWCQNLPALTKVVLNDGIETIDERAFFGCSALAEIELPDTLNTIGKSAFSGCPALLEVNLPEGLQTLGISAFEGCTALRKIKLPTGLQTIPSSAFLGCNALAEIYLPEGLLEIGSSAFKGCAALTDVAVPQSVTKINEAAFRDCASLRSVTLREGLESIRDGAFAGCTSLERMELPDSVTSLGSAFISGDTGLRYIAFGGGVERITWLHTSGLEDSSVEVVVFGEGVKEINNEAFQDCASLGYVSLPESLTRIGRDAFNGCHIPSVYIPASVYLNSNAFTCPEDMESITLYGFAGSRAEEYAKGSERYIFCAVDRAPDQDDALQFSDEVTVSPAEQTVYLGVGQDYAQPGWVFTGGPQFPTAVTYRADGDALSLNFAQRSIRGARLGQAEVTCRVSLDGESDGRLTLDTSFTAVVVYDLTNSLTLGIGQQLELEAEIYEGVAGGQAGVDFNDVTWLCDDEDTIALTPVPGRAAAVVRALASGDASLTMKNEATGATAKVKISVLKAPTDLLLDEDSLELGVDETRTIQYDFKSGEYINDVTFRSLDSTIARVSADGTITAKKVGSTAVQVTAGDVTKEVSVAVGPKPAEMRFADNAVSLLPNCRMVLPEVSLTDADGNKAYGKLTFASDNDNIVSVTGGKLYAKRSGTATVTATTYVPGVEASLTVEVDDNDTWARLLEAETRYNDVKNKLERKIRTVNMRLENKASKFTSDQRSHYQSLLDSRITESPSNGTKGNLPTEIKRRLFNEVCEGMNKGSLSLSGIQTPWALVYAMNAAIVGSGQDTRVFEYGGKHYTYHATMEVGNTQLGGGVSMGTIDDGNGSEWTVVITRTDNISGFTAQLKALADDKVKDAIKETINSAGQMLGIGEISSYLKMLAREENDTFMLYALNLSGNVADQAEDALMRLLGFRKNEKTLSDIADNTEALKAAYNSLEKLFGLKYVDLQEDSEMFSLKKLLNDSSESLERLETAMDFYEDIL